MSIIPIKCFTCGELLADKYEFFLQEVRKNKLLKGENLTRKQHFSETNIKKTIEGDVLDRLELFSVCCRRTMLTHVDIK